MEEDGGPVTPIPAYKVKGKERAAAALGTPELDEWVKAGEGKAAPTADDARKDGKRDAALMKLFAFFYADRCADGVACGAG